jgi:hypothetical protein
VSEIAEIVKVEAKWSMSPTIGKLVESLAKAQLKYDPALKDTTNPVYHSKYADLSSIIEATQPHLNREGLVIVQMPTSEFKEGDAKMIEITTLLAHSSGEWMASTLKLPAMMRERFDSQSCGSAITYGKRYGYSAMAGVAPEVDDDGNKASGVGSKGAAQAVADQKIKDAKKTAGQEGVSLVPWKDGSLCITGNGLSIVRSAMTEATKKDFHFTYDKDAQGFCIPESEGNQFAAIAERVGVKVIWAAQA